ARPGLLADPVVPPSLGKEPAGLLGLRALAQLLQEGVLDPPQIPLDLFARLLPGEALDQLLAVLHPLLLEAAGRFGRDPRHLLPGLREARLHGLEPPQEIPPLLRPSFRLVDVLTKTDQGNAERGEIFPRVHRGEELAGAADPIPEP